MIMKELRKPLLLLKYEAILRRLRKNHGKYSKIEKEFAKRQAGFKGEQSLTYHLSFLPKKDYKILQDLRLKNDLYHFQIDALIITPRYLLILEIKNISGTIFYDHTFKQFIRSINNHEEGIPNPILQVDRQSSQLKSWFQAHHVEPLPIESLVLFSQSSTVLKTSTFNQEISRKIGHIERLFYFVSDLDNVNKREVITNKMGNKIVKLLEKHHTPLNQHVCDVHDIHPTEIQTGVQCPHCFALPMTRVRGKWFCPQCQSYSTDAGHQAIIDYFLLVKSSITSMACREFLHLSSTRIARDILQSMNLPSTGQTKDRVYYPPADLS